MPSTARRSPSPAHTSASVRSPLSTARRWAENRSAVAGSSRRTTSPSAPTARRKPASSKHSRTAATQNAKPPRARPRVALASSSVRPTLHASMSRSRSSTAPPGNTWAPPAKTSRRLRRTMNTSSPSAPSRTSITVAASRMGTVTDAPPSAAARDRGRCHIGSLAGARSLVVDTALEAAADGGPDAGAHRWEEEQQAHRIGDEPGRQEQCTGQQDQRPVDQLPAGHHTGVDLALGAAQRAQTFALHEPGSGEADEDEDPEGVQNADGVTELDDDVQLGDRHEDEQHHQRTEHSPIVVPGTLLARWRARTCRFPAALAMSPRGASGCCPRPCSV